MNILLVAEESAGIQTVQLLSKSSHTLKAVLTQAGSSGKGAPVAAMADKLGYLTLAPSRVNEPSFSDWIKENEIDLLLNVHSLFVICPEVIEALKVGAFNLHPGLLPQYAGLNVPSWAVYNQEIEHGVTLHKISSKIDAGDIIDEARFPITATDTGLSVSLKCVTHGLPLIKSFLAKIKNGDTINGKKQNPENRNYYRGDHIPNHGRIDWGSTASRIDAFVRACNYAPFPSPWGHPVSYVAGEKISILKMRVTNLRCSEKPGTIGETMGVEVYIATADFWVIVRRCLVNGHHIDASSILFSGDMLS